MNTLISSTKLFGLFTLAFIGLTTINLYQVKYIQPTIKELAKYNFYLLGIIWLLNLIITFSYTTGVNKYELPVWSVTVIYWGATVLPLVVITYLWFRQAPTLSQWLGIGLVLAGIILVNAK